MSGHHKHESHLSKNGRQIEQEIEHKLAGSHGNVRDMLYDEVQKLRQMDSTADGKLNKHKFSHDLKAIESTLHHKHLLPHMHLPRDGHKPSSDIPLPPRKPDDLSSKDQSTIPGKPEGNLLHPPKVDDLSARGPQRQAKDTDFAARGTTPHENGADRPPQPADNNQKPAHPPGELSSLSDAIARARAGGRPVSIVQIGDSHIEAGIETPALAKELAAHNGLRSDQVKYGYYGHIGISASYADKHPNEFLKKVDKNTDLVVVSFGSNDSEEKAGRQYTKDYSDLIAKVRERAPNASIVMLGATDGNIWNTKTHLPYLDSVKQAQEGVAASTPNSAYINVRPQMGTVADMRRRGFMTTDNLHLTGDGYRLLGRIVADDISNELKK